MKIGIITELSLDIVNFGNNLQAYALNRYIRTCCPQDDVETIVVPEKEKRRTTSLVWQVKRKCYALLVILQRHMFPERDGKGKRIDGRFQRFIDFARAFIVMSSKTMDLPQLVDSDYDVFLVGSDVVWSQFRGFIRRVKFLDFRNKKGAAKIAYSASFGENWIPPENVRVVRNCLKDFMRISVREAASITLLQSIGAEGAAHTCDPVFLLGREEWEQIELEPGQDVIGGDEILQRDKFCFAYLLGQDSGQRKQIQRLCRQEGLPLVTVPYIDGYTHDGADCFGDIRVMDCGPREWLWLIHHARYVFTDSFHGLAFSVIFSKDCVTVRRKSKQDLNVRLTDFLQTVGAENKMIDPGNLDRLAGLSWDHGSVQGHLKEFKDRSEDYLKEVLTKTRADGGVRHGF